MRTRSSVVRLLLLVIVGAALLAGGGHASASPATLPACTKAKDISSTCIKIFNDLKCDETADSNPHAHDCVAYELMSVQKCQDRTALFSTNQVCKAWMGYVTDDKKKNGTCHVVSGLAGAGCKAVHNITGGVRTGYEVARHPADTLASAAFDAVAGKFGSAATSILHDLTGAFMNASTIDLRTAGISSTYGLTWALSATLAILLLLWQFAKLALTGQGSAAATAITGMVKWALICVATLAVTQTALTATDEISDAIIDSYYKNGGEKAFQQRIDSGFGKFFTTPQQNTAIVLLFGVLGVLVVLVLWGEMLLRQAALQVLLVTMPIVAAGSMMDGTKGWWPKARSAAVSLILIKPVIVLIFVIGFSETGQSSDMQPFLVGLLTIFLGALAWPSLAKFMTFTSVGGGGGLASGLLGAAGGTAGSMFMYRGGSPSGAGSLGGGAGFTKAVESENDAAVASGPGRGSGGGLLSMAAGGAAAAASGGLTAAVSLGAQVAKAGKEMAEGGMEAMAAHAELGPGKDMGGQVNVPYRPGGGEAPQSAGPPPPGDVTPPPAPPPTGGEQASIADAPGREQVTEGGHPPPITQADPPVPLPPAPRQPLALPPAPALGDNAGGE